MFSAPELLVHSPSFPVRGGNNKHAEMWHLGTATRFLLGIYKLENNQNTLPVPLSHSLQLRELRCLWNHSWPLGDQDLHLGRVCSFHLQTCQMRGLVPSEIQRWGQTWGQESRHQRNPSHLNLENRATSVKSNPASTSENSRLSVSCSWLGLEAPQDGAEGVWLRMVRFTQDAWDPPTGSHLEEERAANFIGQSRSFLAHFFFPTRMQGN